MQELRRVTLSKKRAARLLQLGFLASDFDFWFWVSGHRVRVGCLGRRRGRDLRLFDLKLLGCEKERKKVEEVGSRSVLRFVIQTRGFELHSVPR